MAKDPLFVSQKSLSPKVVGKYRRRQFFTDSAIAAAGLTMLLADHASAQPIKESVLIDTHLHCFAGPEDTSFPYHARAPYRPIAAATPEHLLRCMDEAGIGFAIVVHPEPYQDDHRYLEHCLDIGKGRLKGTCLVFSDRPGSMEKLPDLAKRMPIIAARVHAYAPDRLPPFGKPELRTLWRSASELGLAMQLHLEPRYAPGFETLIREFSDTRVIIDHLGRPFQGTPEEHEVIVRWSRYPNTVIKLAAIPSPLTYPHRDPAAVIKRLSQEFGAERMIYGGGFGADATGTSYRGAFEQARNYLSHFSPEEQAMVMGGNALRLFRF